MSSGKAKQDDLKKRARKILEHVLEDFPSPGFIRDTYQDLVAIQEAIEKPRLVDEFLILFKDKWNPQTPSLSKQALGSGYGGQIMITL